jgi:hypothetical protein
MGDRGGGGEEEERLCSCRRLSVHSRKERKIQLFKEGIVQITGLANLLIQAHQLSIECM